VSEEPGYRERLRAAAPVILAGLANDGYCATHNR